MVPTESCRCYIIIYNAGKVSSCLIAVDYLPLSLPPSLPPSGRDSDQSSYHQSTEEESEGESDDGDVEFPGTSHTHTHTHTHTHHGSTLTLLTVPGMKKRGRPTSKFSKTTVSSSLPPLLAKVNDVIQVGNVPVSIPYTENPIPIQNKHFKF